MDHEPVEVDPLENRPKSKAPWRHAWAIVRVDWGMFHSNDDFKSVNWDGRIKVKEIVNSRECAEEEVARLNSLRPDIDTHYFWQLTRIYDER